MTVHTRRQRVVRDRIDLRKAGGTGWIVSVAAYAELAHPWDRRLLFYGIGHVGRAWTMARFAGDAPVVGGQAPLSNTTVAECALLLPSVFFRMGHDGVHGRRTIMPHFAEGLGHEKTAGDHKGNRG